FIAAATNSLGSVGGTSIWRTTSTSTAQINARKAIPASARQGLAGKFPVSSIRRRTSQRNAGLNGCAFWLAFARAVRKRPRSEARKVVRFQSLGREAFNAQPQ